MELKLQWESLGGQQSTPTQPGADSTLLQDDAESSRLIGAEESSPADGSRLLIITVEGEVDTNTAGALEASLVQEFEQGARLVILELSQMDYVSSVGLRVLLAHLKKLKTSQGRMVLTGLNDEVQEIFDMAGFSALFEISPNLEAAKQALQA